MFSLRSLGGGNCISPAFSMKLSFSATAALVSPESGGESTDSLVCSSSRTDRMTIFDCSWMYFQRGQWLRRVCLCSEPHTRLCHSLHVTTAEVGAADDDCSSLHVTVHQRSYKQINCIERRLLSATNRTRGSYPSIDAAFRQRNSLPPPPMQTVLARALSWPSRALALI